MTVFTSASRLPGYKAFERQALNEEDKMKSLTLNSLCVAGLLAALAMPARLVAQEPSASRELRPDSTASTHYTIVDLGVVGTNPNQPGQPFVISDSGWVSGGAGVGAAEHAVLWHSGQRIDIGDSGLGGNSIAFGANESGQSVGEAEDTSEDLSTTEDFCGFHAMGYSTSPTPCVPFIWSDGKMVPLRTLGGVNGVANQINSWGAIAGYAENRIKDPGCPKPQEYEFKPVIWLQDWILPLPTGREPEGVAFSINEWGQVAGSSGTCAAFNPSFLFNFQPVHALLWQDGEAINLGTLGGALNNFAHDVNNRGEVVVGSDLTGDQTSHAFLWTPKTGKMKDLGTVSGDVWSAGLGINDAGEIVGVSINADFTVLHAFVRQNGVLVDLNTLVAGTTSLSLETACSINSAGEIIGFASDQKTGDTHAYLAKPFKN
jgi:probable HAF family extracellular repeat protein